MPSSLASFAGKSSRFSFGVDSEADKVRFGEDAALVPRNYDSARKLEEDNPSVWDRISKELMKPVSVVAVASEQVGKTLGNAFTGDWKSAGEEIYNTPGKLGGIITGTTRRSFLDVYSENYRGAGLEMDTKGDTDTTAIFVNDVVPRLLGTITDIAADPLNFVGGGLTKAGKLSEKVTALHKIGETVKADSKLAAQIKALGITDDMLELAATKSEQVQKGQRAFLTIFANTRWEKSVYGGARLYDLMDVAGTGIKNSKVGQLVGQVFSTKSSDEGFNLVREHFDNLRAYRDGQVMDEALKVQNFISELPEGSSAKIVDIIENAGGQSIKVTDDLTAAANRLQSNLDEINKAEKALGLRVTDIQDYFPHQLKRGEAAKTMTGWQKFKELFYKADGKFVDDADEVVDSFGNARKYSTKLDAARARKYEGSIAQIRENFGIDFNDDAAVAYAQRALGSSKAQTSAEFFESVKQFGKPLDAVTDARQFVFGPTGVDDGMNIKRAIDAGDIAREAIYKGTGDVLQPAYASGRIQDLAAKLDELQEGLGATFRASVNPDNTTMKNLTETASNLLDGASASLREPTANYVTTKVKELSGLKFSPDVARQIDQYYESVKPENLNKALKAFDTVQNWWKAQALVAPSYHTRNFFGNMWNNFLAGVVDPQDYMKAGSLQQGKMVEFVDDAGRQWDNATLMKAAKQSGVINEGWYAKDIETAIGSEIGGVSWNPLKQNFALFRANRAVGTVFENNARLAHFIQRIRGGATIDDAALSVKKYLFDYGDLTWTEKNIFKRIVPFYTWTRKNIPLQVGELIKQPGKFSAVPKVTNFIESGVEEPNEKYLGDYIRDNVGIRVGTDPEGNTMYFLLGQWLPAAQAIDFISQPTENFIQSVSPFFKTPVELWANQSTFFEDTFGQPSKIERYPGENQSWLGLTMRKKTAYVLKNIRLLNELDKLNPGSIFGDKDTPSLANRIAPEAGFKAPFGIGHITTSEERGGRLTPETTQANRILASMFGKTSVYNPNYAKRFYLWDTETKIRELERAIKDAQRDGQKEYAARLREELINIKKSR